MVQEVRCPACGAADSVDFLQVERIPANVGSLCRSRSEALDATMGRIDLTWCPRCRYIHNRSFNPALVRYEPGYDAALFHSPVFRGFIEKLAADLLERFELRRKHIIEIGCGSGWFLRRLCELGANHGMGFDPCVVNEGVQVAGKGSVSLVRDYFTDQYRNVECDFVCCLDVFEAIPRPLDFLKMVRRTIGARECGVFFETPSASHMMATGGAFSLYYEQVSFFTRESLSNVFARAGFDVLRAGECYVDGQYLFVEAMPGEAPDESDLAMTSAMPADLTRFAEEYQQKLATWSQRTKEYRSGGKRVVSWGTGGKGIGFLNAVDPDGSGIQLAVDINENKHGWYVPGSGHRVVGPRELTQLKPDVVIITNPLYEGEIRRTVSELGLSPTFQAI